MPVRLRDRITMPATPRHTFRVCRKNVLVSLGMMLFEPGQQRRTKVETYPRVITDGRIRRITLIVNALVPIVKRRRTRLQLNFTGPGVFARGLIEVTVDDQSFHTWTGLTEFTGL